MNSITKVFLAVTVAAAVLVPWGKVEPVLVKLQEHFEVSLQPEPLPIVIEQDAVVSALTQEIRAAAAPLAEVLKAENDKSSFPLRRTFYLALAEAVERAGDNVDSTKKLAVINSLAGQWTFQGRFPPLDANKQIEEFFNIVVSGKDVMLVATRRARAVAAYRAIAWAFRTTE